jgi:hypothetical protein
MSSFVNSDVFGFIAFVVASVLMIAGASIPMWGDAAKAYVKKTFGK